MNFDLKQPCGNCPFRKVGAFELRPGRLEEIVSGLQADDHSWFVCHKTLLSDDRSQCVGAMVYLLKVDSPSMSMRLAASLGVLDYDALRAQYDTIIDPPTRNPRDVSNASITCPRCQRVSYNASDIREGYCGACHDWTLQSR